MPIFYGLRLETNKQPIPVNLPATSLGFIGTGITWALIATEVAGRTGLEPAASGVTGRRYNRLNYNPAKDLL